MSFFKKLKDRMFRSSDKIGAGLDALVEDAAPAAAVPPEPAKPGLIGRLLGREADEPKRVMDDDMLESLEELLMPSGRAPPG